MRNWFCSVRFLGTLSLSISLSPLHHYYRQPVFFLRNLSRSLQMLPLSERLLCQPMMHSFCWPRYRPYSFVLLSFLLECLCHFTCIMKMVRLGLCTLCLFMYNKFMVKPLLIYDKWMGLCTIYCILYTERDIDYCNTQFNHKIYAFTFPGCWCMYAGKNLSYFFFVTLVKQQTINYGFFFLLGNEILLPSFINVAHFSCNFLLNFVLISFLCVKQISFQAQMHLM